MCRAEAESVAWESMPQACHFVDLNPPAPSLNNLAVVFVYCYSRVSPAAAARRPPWLHQRDDRNSNPIRGNPSYSINTRGPTTPSSRPLDPTPAARTDDELGFGPVTCASPSNLASPRRLAARNPVPSTLRWASHQGAYDAIASASRPHIRRWTDDELGFGPVTRAPPSNLASPRRLRLAARNTVPSTLRRAGPTSPLPRYVTQEPPRCQAAATPRQQDVQAPPPPYDGDGDTDGSEVDDDSDMGAGTMATLGAGTMATLGATAMATPEVGTTGTPGAGTTATPGTATQGRGGNGGGTPGSTVALLPVDKFGRLEIDGLGLCLAQARAQVQNKLNKSCSSQIQERTWLSPSTGGLKLGLG
ncbi:hypothetical protein EDB85DRAFT_1895801 [Lactarius pseudohatsudake]|nr:hypothetical protein EDB85DRAFT_1895801 [Lactarius pseudohatsudake]